MHTTANAPDVPVGDGATVGQGATVSPGATVSKRATVSKGAPVRKGAPVGKGLRDRQVDVLLRGLRDRWEQLDADGAAELFTDDVVYRPSPFEEPVLGRAAVRRHLVETMASQGSVRIWWGEPLRFGEWVTVEWWATFDCDNLDGGPTPTALGGMCVVHLSASGLCREFRSYAMAGTRRPPYPGWGRLLTAATALHDMERAPLHG
jgi:SnoaL-like domain